VSDPQGSSAVDEAEADAETDVSLGDAFDADGGTPGEPLVRDSVHRRDRESRSKTRAAEAARQPAAAAQQARAEEESESNDDEDEPVHAQPRFEGRSVQVPLSFKQAMASPEAMFWRKAVEECLSAHRQLGTFVEEEVSARKKVLPTRWVFSLKTDQSGNVIKFKARFVVKGFLQRKGVDFNQVFSPAMRGEQWRLMVAVATSLAGKFGRGVLSKADVVNAYLQAPLPEDEMVLFALPEGYVAQSVAGAGRAIAARSIRAQMGLKQSGRVWYQHQRSCLLKLGFTPSSTAPCLYVKEVDGGFVLVGVFVDDLLVINATGNPGAVDEVWAALKQFYDVKTEGKLSKFLGAEFDECEEGLFLHLNQYITTVLERFGEAESKAELTSESDAKATDEESEELLQWSDKQTYQSITGALMYIMATCRPDIAHAVNARARRMNRPRVCDLRAARHVLRYLQGTRRLGILFKYEPSAEQRGLVAFSDSDWAQDPVERRSTTGFITFYNGAAISWYCGLQTVVAASSCEAEYTALAECCREVSYLRALVYFLHEPALGATKIMVDNQGAIDLVENPVHHKRTKHIEIRFHIARTAQESGEILVTKVHTSDNHADIFTKGTTGEIFHRHVAAIMHYLAPAA
jgi:hypothetical protein